MKKVLLAIMFLASACVHQPAIESSVSQNGDGGKRTPAEYPRSEYYDSYRGSPLQTQLNGWSGYQLIGRAATYKEHDGNSKDLNADCFVEIEGGRGEANITLSIPKIYKNSYRLTGMGQVGAHNPYEGPVTMTYTYDHNGLAFTFAPGPLNNNKYISEVMFPSENGTSYICKVKTYKEM